jgi:hypothetical protein
MNKFNYRELIERISLIWTDWTDLFELNCLDKLIWCEHGELSEQARLSRTEW